MVTIGTVSLKYRLGRSGLDVPAKKSVLIETVAFTEPQPVAFPGHVDSTLLSAPPSCRGSVSLDIPLI